MLTYRCIAANVETGHEPTSLMRYLGNGLGLGDFFQRMLFTETIVGEALDAHEGSPTYRADVRVRGVTVV
ncbi:MAG: hypothetical protein ABSD31_21710, partial [Candidatus Binataceae bacterium]